MTLYRGPGGTGSATSDADTTLYQQFLDLTEAARDAAIAAQAAAELAETNAETAEANAEAAEAGVAASAAAAEAAADAAEISEDNAATSATNAAASASAANTSDTNAASSASAAFTSASNAATSATSASDSAAIATTQATNAATSASGAFTSASNAATSASAALTSQNAAASSASSASGSASAAASSQAAAASSAAAAAASFDSFDDRYLGAKETDPSVDNDGNVLLEGALYWNSVANEFRAWNGSSWEGLTGLPSVSGQSGKFLSTNGSTTLWATVPDPQPATPTNDGLVYGVTDDDALVTYTGWPATYSMTDSTVGGYWSEITSTSILDVIPFSPSNITTLISVASPGDPIYVTYLGTTYYLGTYVSGTTTVTGGTGRFVEVFYNNAGGSGFTSNAQSATYVFSSPSSGSNANVSLGYGSNNSNGGANTAVGYGAGSTITTGSNLTVIGYDAEPSSATATNEVTLGNSDVTKTRIWGALAINDQTGTTGQVLTSNGTSTPTWQTPSSAPVTSVNGETGAVMLDAADVGAATTAQGANADTAFGWGNHALVGYATYPTQTGNSGKYLTTNGSVTSWASVEALPSQTGNAGKYLTTNGTVASWGTLDTDANKTTKGLYENSNTISANYSITSGNNAMSAGPITVNSGVTVTVPSGSVWTIV